ncbi:MAG: transglycosylase SLT domain-containing protein, partial [Kangiellaceae bacterium]|nr:transglycosylase SLT domain-containing protein [Kangiellaceae bacterium]
MLKILLSVVVMLSVSGCSLFGGSINTNNQKTSNQLTTDIPTAKVETKPIDVVSIDDLQNNATEITTQLSPDEFQVAEVDDLWMVIRDNLSLAIPNNKRFVAQRNWYLKHPKYIERVSKRASPYLYHVVKEIKKRNMPMELALLPIVESAFDPFAYSHGRASGMWQFIPGTAKQFGLRQNWWYDGRRDIYYSTIAALDFLQYLNKRFKGNWLHAIAAYNSGEGHVFRAIRKNRSRGRPTDFWSLDLPRETEAYVPKLLALSELLANYQSNGLRWTKVANKPYFEKVFVDSQIDLVVAADLAGIEMNEFYTLNPAYNQWATEAKKPAELLVPISQAEKFREKLKNTPKANRIAFKRYTIKPGDSLLKLSKKFNTTVALLRSTNNIRGNTIQEGKALLIPTAAYKSGSYSKSSANRLAAKQNRKRQGNKLTIRVQRGDSFWSL